LSPLYLNEPLPLLIVDKNDINTTIIWFTNMNDFNCVVV